MAYGTGGVFKRREIFWVHFSSQGRVFRESAHTASRDEALAFLAQRRCETGIDATPTTGDTVADLAGRVIARYTKKKRKSTATARGHEKAWLAALGGATPVTTLTVESLQLVLDAWEEEGYKPATLNRRLAFLRLGMRLLKRRDQIDFAELRQLEENEREGFVSRAEFDRLYAATVACDPDLADFFAWLYVTGMRRGEAGQLTLDMVDRRTWTLRIPGRVQKHGKNRPLKLSPTMQAIIGSRLAKATRGCSFLFHRAGEPIRHFKHVWKTLTKTAGLVGVRPHDFRRSAITNMFDAGFTIPQIMAVTGHKTAAMVLRYAQIDDHQLDAKYAALPAPSCLTGTAA
jgi:integrase